MKLSKVQEISGDVEPLSAPPLRKPALLFLCHRIPYPPDKGDKIRAFHLLRYLAERYDVYLATFVDDEADWVHEATVRQYCAGAYFAPLNGLMARARSMRGLIERQALSIPFYANRPLQAWVGQVSQQKQITRRVVFSSVMGQFLPDQSLPSRTVTDFVDVDSDKWDQYARMRKGPMAWIYKREARLLARYEKKLADASDMSLFVSEAEAAFFRSRTALTENQCSHYCNGVDAQYFDPTHLICQMEEPAEELVFTGAMDYWPNVDAVRWFAYSVLPQLQQLRPGLRFTIVGGKPTSNVLDLANLPGVVVTGRVPDVRPYIARALAVVAPMRIARGVQNKVLEAMAMAKPVLVTPMGLEGIDAGDKQTVLVANQAEDYSRCLAGLLDNQWPGLGARARDLVIERYSWESTLSELPMFLEVKSGVDVQSSH